MLPRPRVFAVVLSLALAQSARAQSTDVLSLPWKTWSFHVGNDPRCASADPKACIWEKPGTPKLPPEGEIWQRIEVTIPGPLQSFSQLGLLVQGEWPVYEVFLNGRSIGGSGSFQSRSGPQDSRAIFPFATSLAPGGRLVITIHALNLRTALDPMDFTPRIAPMDRIAAIRDADTLRNLSDDWYIYLCYLIMLSVGVVFLVLYALDRSARENLWLGLNLFALGCLCCGNFATVVDTGVSSTVALAVFYFWNSAIAVIIIEFSFALMRKRVWLVFRLAEFFGCLFAIQFLYLAPIPGSIFEPLVSMSQYFYFDFRTCLLIAAISRLLPLPTCFKSPLPEMRWIGACLLFIAIAAESRHFTSMWSRTVRSVVYFGAPNYQFLSISYAIFAIVMLAAMTARFRRIQNRNQIMEQELAAASAVQHLLLSSSAPAAPSFSIKTVYLPAGEVGGDFFHIAHGARSDDPLLIVVGDVSGKGLQAAITVAAIIGALRGTTERGPAAILDYLNRVLLGQVTGFVTCCAAAIDPQGIMRLANAGNPPPYCNGREIDAPVGLPLGIVASPAYEEIANQLAPLDVLTFLSDGVVEARNHAGELFGFDRARAISTQSAETIAATAQSFGQEDDITVLTLTRLPPSPEVAPVPDLALAPPPA